MIPIIQVSPTNRSYRGIFNQGEKILIVVLLTN
ncbi:uncharacterized protein METZ01_LOCUS168416 [marine metagenome]|uniref:Uncharacterized protein n=1 Tax=marine metagenome TaxID=408172 RepID=A0A382BQ83_9ZZZZ